MNPILRFVVPTLQGGGGSTVIWRCISSKGTGCCQINAYAYKLLCNTAYFISESAVCWLYKFET
ncbi:hypothetical protein BpHYR1_011506 [Brachionus plicatilis]|uniref:Uncharacterized protein n=1 Tax=Brachionus plicatilis TaxID=10195 RepID=A0A3M7S4C0_BRAPC|nr:hypothetical protein BpHYR1_011506 [Brachionus plicatilis]